MVKKSWKRVVCMILVLAMTVAMSNPSVSQAAKKKAPKLSKKKVTLTVGKTVKLKVKNTKKKIKWSSSKKSVATVNKKGKVTAKKAGKATITAKIGKKKLKCKVTVKAKKATTKVTPKPSAKPTQKPSSAGTGQTEANNVIASIAYEDAQTLIVTLKKAQRLKSQNFVIKTKKYANGSYNRKVSIDKIKTEDNLTYKIFINDNYRIKYGEYVQVTVTDTTGVTSVKEALAAKIEEKETKSRYRILTSEEVNINIELSGYGYATILSVDLPKGLKYEYEVDSGNDDCLIITGKPTETGNFQKKIVYKDELGNKYTEKITWMLANENVIVADCDQTYHTYRNYTISGSNNFYVIGGSGNYTYNVISEGVTINEEDQNLGTTFDKAGTHKMTVEVADANNAELKTSFTWVANVAQARKLTVNVVDAKGEPIGEEVCELTATAKEEDSPYESYYWDSLYDISSFTVWAVDGFWDIKAAVDGYEYTLKNYEVKGSDKEVEIRMPVYKITVPETEGDFEYIDWHDGTEEKGSGTSFYAPIGTISYYSIEQKDFTNLTYRVTCTVSATAENVAVVTKSEETAICGAIGINTPVTLELTYPNCKYYKFIPTETGTYKFYSVSNLSNEVDTYGKLTDEELSFSLTDDDGNGNRQFKITKECEVGKTYYVGVCAYSNNHIGKSVSVKVEKVEETE